MRKGTRDQKVFFNEIVSQIWIFFHNFAPVTSAKFKYKLDVGSCGKYKYKLEREHDNKVLANSGSVELARMENNQTLFPRSILWWNTLMLHVLFNIETNRILTYIIFINSIRKIYILSLYTWKTIRFKKWLLNRQWAQFIGPRNYWFGAIYSEKCMQYLHHVSVRSRSRDVKPITYSTENVHTYNQ